jgi:8-oxo-dGTP pyrophosphatase MutT (NUDIX family)
MASELNDRVIILRLLENYQPLCAEQLSVRDRMMAFRDYPNCLARDNFYGHLTASAWVIDPKGENALLTLHRKIGLWLQLGGHSEDTPDLLDVAMREVQEESGLSDLKPVIPGIFDLDVHRIPDVGQDPSHFHFDVRFFLQLQQDQPLIISEESIDLAWYRPEEIFKLNTDASVKRLCEKWQTYNESQCALV